MRASQLDKEISEHRESGKQTCLVLSALKDYGPRKFLTEPLSRRFENLQKPLRNLRSYRLGKPRAHHRAKDGLGLSEARLD